jgi:hypothetical protein
VHLFRITCCNFTYRCNPKSLAFIAIEFFVTIFKFPLFLCPFGWILLIKHVLASTLLSNKQHSMDEDHAMKTISLIAATIVAILSITTPTYSQSETSQTPAVQSGRNTLCTGWSSEISEIAGALHEVTMQSGTDISDLLYKLEDSAHARCSSSYRPNKLVARQYEQDIAKAAAEIERSIATTRATTSAERVLTAALLKLIRSQIDVQPIVGES